MVTKQEELEMMTHPMRWPQMVLPLKKAGGCEIGILLGNKPTVYLVNMWMLAGPLSKLEEGPKREYESYEDIVADGWVVD